MLWIYLYESMPYQLTDESYGNILMKRSTLSVFWA